MTAEKLIQFALLAPLIGAVLIPFFGNRKNFREAVTLISGFALFISVIGLYPFIIEGTNPQITILEMIPGLSIFFLVEPLGFIFSVIASFLWIITSIYSIGYMRGHDEKNQTRFYFFFAIAIFAAIGIAFSGNLLTLFVFYEILTLSTFPLVTHHGTNEAKKAGRLYFGILIGSSIAFQLTAIIWTWFITGTLDFTPGGILANNANNSVISILLLLYTFGVAKAAIMPLHRWLPAAMVAPTPVSALLHAVAVVKAGVFTILKIAIYIFGSDLLIEIATSRWLLYLATVTVLIGSLVAMSKDNLKARLAYSTISQLSYIIIGAMLASNLGFIGGGMHIAMHAFGKITLFFCAGAILVAAHKTEISQMRGIGYAMPFTLIGFIIGSLSIIGLPPMGGLWSKWYLALGAMEANELVIVIVLLLSSLLNVFYLLQIPFQGFLKKASMDPEQIPSDLGQINQEKKIKEAPLCCLIAIGITSFSCLFLFFYPELLYDLMKIAIKK